MSKKYVIEMKSEYEDTIRGIMILGARDSNLYMDALAVEDMEELNSDYINEHYGDLQDTAYQRGLEDGKWKSEDGCTGCKYEGKTGEHLPCDYCMNNFKNQWTSDKIEVGDEDSIIAGDEVKAEDGTVVFFVTWMSDRCICGVDKEGKCYSYEPKEICGKTGRHFDIILEEKKA